MRIPNQLKPLAWAALAAALFGAWALAAENAGDALARGFENPPDSAKPRVWWHWMNGNITKEGIKLDLEWMKRVGIGGFQNFDAAINTPQVVDKRLVYMTPEWKDAFKYAMTEADQLGLEAAVAGSPGWSESGGPWVPPAQAMKKYVWSETSVEGGHPFTGALPKPPAVTGPFQNIPYTPRMGITPNAGEAAVPTYYADAAVVAYRLPDSESAAAGEPTVTASGGSFALVALTDGDFTHPTELPLAAVNEKSWIQYEYAAPQTIRGITIAMGGPSWRAFGGRFGPRLIQVLEASDNSTDFRTVVEIPMGGSPVHTIAFPAVTARYFRLAFTNQGPPPVQAGMPAPSTMGVRVPTAIPVTEFEIHHSARVNRFEDKAAFGLATNLYAAPTPSAPSAETVQKSSVIDLTSKMRPDGTLDWTPPAGHWMVLRIGYSLIGTTNHPATPEATGLEVDKLSGPFVKNYLEHYLDMYKSAAGSLMGKRGLQYVIFDSWEAGSENWTDDMMAEFRKRRGYDMHPWMPVLAGRVVESAEASDRFLWDFRKTICELTAENHYDQATTLLHARGMGRYTESHENGRAIIADGMEPKRTADVPMSAMWTGRGGHNGEPANYNADIRESASVAHIFGQNLVAAESLTAGSGAFTFSPETLKPTADAELAMGLNRFVIHTSVHQPVSDKRPGLSLGPYGQWFTRLETWGEEAKPWTTYLARSSYMLQQGKFVADLLYYYGEDSNITALFGNEPPDIPAGYNFDFANSDVILHRLEVSDGRIVTPTGMSYRVVALDANARHMPLSVLRKLHSLVEQGGVVSGPKPIDSPSLSDDQAEFQRLAQEMFGDGSGEHSIGKGKVFAGATPEQAMTALQVAPDFTFTKPEGDTNLLFVHRRLPDGDVYWVDNRKNRVETLEGSFRVIGKAPQLWHADTGAMEPAAYQTVDGRTTVPLHLYPYDAVFVVFRDAASAPSRTLPKHVETTLTTVEGSWDVAFQPDRGAPAKVSLDRLASWTENSDPGVKYFSGTATYQKTIQASPDWFQSKAELWLDLGNVKNLAEVSVNGKPLGIVWKTPFRVNLTGALKPGANTLEVKVTNLWVNRIVGDQQPGVTQKYTFTAQQFYRADSPLLESGLIGPVQVVKSAVE
jgi:hypothetical protein